jgi:general control protein GCN4
MTGNSFTFNTFSNDMTLTHDPDFVTSFDGLDADFGAGFDASGDFSWDTSSNFTAVNNGTGATSTSTVSPKDLYNDIMGSAPPSTAFTNLTSPDINASPYMASSTELSPLFQNTEELGADASSWYSLFPDDSAPQSAPPMERNGSNMTDGSSGDSPLILDEHNFRRKTSNAPSASPGHGRHSSISGVKSRRRKAPLLPIAVNGDDKVAVKRARNTLAARESRQRKLDHLGGLEARIKELEDREAEFKATLSSYGYNGPLMQM